MVLLGRSPDLDLSTFRVACSILEHELVSLETLEDWAVDLLVAGVDTATVRQLTGATNLDQAWCDSRAREILVDSAISVDQDGAEVVERLAVSLFLCGTLTLHELLTFGRHLHYYSAYESMYAWGYVYEDLHFIEGGEPYRLTGLAGETARQFEKSLRETLAFDLANARRNPDFKPTPLDTEIK